MFDNQAEFFQCGYIPMSHDCQQHAAGGLSIGLYLVMLEGVANVRGDGVEPMVRQLRPHMPSEVAGA